MLCKIRHYVPQTELKSIYYAIFSSHMMYGAQVWGQSITTHTEKVFKLQNRAMRIINFSNFRADADPLYQTNKILKLEDYVKMQNCLFVHDFLNKNLPVCFDDYFQKLEDVYTEDTNTINSELGCLYTPYKSTEKYGLCSITRKCIDSWNFFTKELKINLSTLSRSVLKGKINKYFHNDDDAPINNGNNNININNNNHNNINNNNINNNNNNNNNANNNNNNDNGLIRFNRPWRSRWDL